MFHLNQLLELGGVSELFWLLWKWLQWQLREILVVHNLVPMPDSSKLQSNYMHCM